MESSSYYRTFCLCFFIIMFTLFHRNSAFSNKPFGSLSRKVSRNGQFHLFSGMETIRRRKPMGKTDSMSPTEVMPVIAVGGEPIENEANNKKCIFSMKTTETSRFTHAEALSPIFSPNDQAQFGKPISFVVFGEPLALARHRSSRAGFMYNPSSKFQKDFLKLSKPFLPHKPMEGPIAATFSFFFERPKNHYGTGKNSGIMKKGKPKYHDSRSDLDNLVKFVMDALNGAAYNDDSQICKISCTKMYVADIDDPARIEVHFRALTEAENSL